VQYIAMAESTKVNESMYAVSKEINSGVTNSYSKGLVNYVIILCEDDFISFINSFINSLIHSLIQSFIRSFIRSISYLFKYLLNITTFKSCKLNKWYLFICLFLEQIVSTYFMGIIFLKQIFLHLETLLQPQWTCNNVASWSTIG